MRNLVETLKNRDTNKSKKWNPDYIKKRFKIESDKKIYPLFIADMDFAHSDILKEKFHEIIDRDDFGYFDIPETFFESIVSWHNNIHQKHIKQEWIIPAHGTIAAMHVVAEALMKDDKFLVLTPVYGGFKDLTCRFGTRTSLALDQHEDRYSLNLETFEETIKDESIDTLIFCNPHNPSGKVWSFQELKEIITICKENNVKILSDEIHADLLREDEVFTSMLDFHEFYDQIIVSTSANKTFNISGLNASYLLTANLSFKEQIENTLEKFHICTNRVGMEYTRIAYEYGEAWYRDVRAAIDYNLTIVQKTLKDTNLKIMMPGSSYLIWVKLSKVKNVDEYILELARDTGVLLESGSRFIDDYNGYARINVACDSELLEEAMIKFKNHYNNL